jgi:hypothetical protein
MRKRTRDLKKHYRNIERALRDFNLDLSEESWYRMWHIHLDWDGTTSLSVKHRKIHILYYVKILEKIDEQTKGNKREFQTWIYLDGHQGTYDALYIHTENPEGDFPYCLDNIVWNTEVSAILINLLDLSKFHIGKLKGKKENMPSYIIQKRELGLRIENR